MQATFPARSEVDRFLYPIRPIIVKAENQFPSPLEVDRFLYTTGSQSVAIDNGAVFPAPREVDRFLYQILSVL